MDARDEPRGKVRRRVYTLTDLGRAELDEWLRSESDDFELRDEGLLRLFFGDLVEPDAARHALRPPCLRVRDERRLFRGIGGEMTITGPTAHVLGTASS